MDQICAKPLGKFMQPECNYSAIKSCRQMYFASCAEDWGCEGCSTEEGNFHIFGGYCILRDESDLEMRVPLPNILFWISKSVRTVNKRIYYIHIIILSDYVILCYVSKNTYHTCISLHIIRLQHLHFLEVQPSRSNLADQEGMGQGPWRKHHQPPSILDDLAENVLWNIGDSWAIHTHFIWNSGDPPLKNTFSNFLGEAVSQFPHVLVRPHFFEAHSKILRRVLQCWKNVRVPSMDRRREEPPGNKLIKTLIERDPPTYHLNNNGNNTGSGWIRYMSSVNSAGIGDRLDSESPVASFSCPTRRTRRTRQFEGPDLVWCPIHHSHQPPAEDFPSMNHDQSTQIIDHIDHDESWCTWMHWDLGQFSFFWPWTGFISHPKPTAVGPVGLHRASPWQWSAMEPCKTWDVSTLVSPNLPRRRQLHFRCAMKNQEISQEKLDNPKTMEVSRNLIGLCHSLTSNLIII